MNYKVFFLIVLLVLVAITGYYVDQLHSSQAVWCIPYWDMHCEADANIACDYNEFAKQLIGSWCDGADCRAAYVAWCDLDGTGIGLTKVGPFFCVDEGTCGGGPN